MLTDNVLTLMKQRKLNLLQLSKRSGVPHSTLVNMFSRSDNCRVATIVKLADYFNVTTDFLIRGIDNSDPHETAVLYAYREQPDLQKAVDKLLGVVDDLPDTAGDDLAGTLKAVSSINTIKGR